MQKPEFVPENWYYSVQRSGNLGFTKLEVVLLILIVQICQTLLLCHIRKATMSKKQSDHRLGKMSQGSDTSRASLWQEQQQSEPPCQSDQQSRFTEDLL